MFAQGMYLLIELDRLNKSHVYDDILIELLLCKGRFARLFWIQGGQKPSNKIPQPHKVFKLVRNTTRHPLNLD